MKRASLGNVLDLWIWERIKYSLISPHPKHMVLEPIQCPACQCTNVVKHGKSTEGKQRYKCRNTDCSRSTFIKQYCYRGY